MAWYWLLPAFAAGTVFGLVITALLVAAGEADGPDEPTYLV